MPRTPRVIATVPPALFDAARGRLGLGDDAAPSHVIRAALAVAAGEDIAKHLPMRKGPAPRRAA
jgi:hypothetical protein